MEENINLLDTYYSGVVEKDLRENSNGAKILNDNKIDNYEMLGIDKEDAAGIYPIKEKDTKIQEASENGFLNDFLELGKNLVNSDVVKSTKSRVPEGLINIADFGTNIFNSFDKLFSLDPNYERSEIFNKWSENLETARNKLQDQREDVKGKMSDMVGMIAQDLPAYYAIDKILKKAKVKPVYRVPLAIGLSYALSFDETEEDIFVNSKQVKDLKHILNILPDTPEDQLMDDVSQFTVGFGTGKLFQGLKPALQFIKRNSKAETVTDIAQIAAGGAVIAGSTMQDAQGKEIPGIPEPININEKPTIDASDPKLMEMGASKIFPEIAKTVVPKLKEIISPIFKSNVVEAVNKIPNKGSGNQILGQIKNIPGVKETELKWIGLDDFLKNKKSVTKQEVSEFVQNNRIDVNEVKFGGNTQAAKLSDDIEFQKNEFEQKVLDDVYKKDPDMIGEVPEELLEEINYDVFAIKLGKITDDVGTMDFNTLASVIGQDFTEATFEKMPNGLLKYKGSNIIPSGKKDADLFIQPLELEKYKVENAVRKFRDTDGAPKFERFTESGGEDYTELVFTIKKGGMDIGVPFQKKWQVQTGRKYREKGTVPFKNPSHMNVKSEIAHVRFKTRNLNGKKVLTVEEMQSDFAIKAKKLFSQKEDNLKDLKMDFPFKNTWYELTIKRLIRYAADNGFDAIAIPKGSVAAQRYGQNINKIKKIEVTPHDTNADYLKGDTSIEPGFNVRLSNIKGKTISEKTVVGFPGEEGFIEEMSSVLRKDVGEKNYSSVQELIFDSAASGGNSVKSKILDKEVITGSGIGKYELYDLAIPSFMKKYSKKWNAKVYDDNIKFKDTKFTRDLRIGDRTRDIPVTILEITPTMKKAVQEGGQSLFEILGFATAGGVGAKAVSENIQNNIISKQTKN